jgi:hypothetical protein
MGADAQIAEGDRENWVKLVQMLQSTLTQDQKHQAALVLARTARPSDLDQLLSAGAAPLKSDAELPPLAAGLTAEQRAAVAAALETRYLADPTALGGLGFNQIKYLRLALARCGWTKAQVSEMTAACVNAAEAWRSWSNEEVSRLLVLLEGSGSDAASGARVKVVDVCLERDIYRFGDDPMLAGRAGISIDAQLVVYLKSKLQSDAGDVRPSAAVLLAWHYAMTDKQALAQWQGELDQRLSDASLQGDRRAGWLLARAYAGSAGSKFTPLAVDQLLQQVLAVAESESLRLAAVELLVRGYVLSDLFEQATSLLDSVEGQFAEDSSRQRLGAWREAIPPAAQRFREEQLAAEVEAKQAHRQVLQKRLQEAQQNNDQERIARYQQLLNQQ